MTGGAIPPRRARARAAQPAEAPRDLWPRDFGHDGVSGLVTVERGMRARDVSRPRPEDEAAADHALEDLLSRVEGRSGQRRSAR